MYDLNTDFSDWLNKWLLSFFLFFVRLYHGNILYLFFRLCSILFIYLFLCLYVVMLRDMFCLFSTICIDEKQVYFVWYSWRKKRRAHVQTEISCFLFYFGNVVLTDALRKEFHKFLFQFRRLFFHRRGCRRRWTVGFLRGCF